MRVTERLIAFQKAPALECLKDSFLCLHAFALCIVHHLPPVKAAMNVCRQPARNVADRAS
jgi:hypothetical protein